MPSNPKTPTELPKWETIPNADKPQMGEQTWKKNKPNETNPKMVTKLQINDQTPNVVVNKHFHDANEPCVNKKPH